MVNVGKGHNTGYTPPYPQQGKLEQLKHGGVKIILQIIVGTFSALTCMTRIFWGPSDISRGNFKDHVA